MQKKIITVLGDAGHDHDALWNSLAAIVTAQMADHELEDISPAGLESALQDQPDLLVISKMNNLPEKAADGSQLTWLNADREEALVSYVAAGGSLVVWHSGLYGHPAEGKFIQMMGGRFFHKPPNILEVTYSPVAGAPVALNQTTFKIMDEHYQVVCDPEKSSIFLQSSSSEGNSPAGWSREFGHGRICYLAGPHPTGSQTQAMDEVVLACLKWCAKSK